MIGLDKIKTVVTDAEGVAFSGDWGRIAPR